MTTLDQIEIVPEQVAALEARVRREVDEGLLPSAQFALAKDGEIIAQGTFGDATAATRYPIFSSTKAVVSSAVLMLLTEGKVSLSDRVGDILEGFAENGKQDVTVEQVMLHTAGFPLGILDFVDGREREKRLHAYRGWTLMWEPGTQYMYHHSSAHFVLGDIIFAVTGIDHRDFVRQRVIEPLGLESFELGIPRENQTDLSEQIYVGGDMTPDELEAWVGIREIPAPPGSLAAMGDFAILLNDPDIREVGIPGGGAFSTANDMALFYQALLHNDGGLWDSKVLDDAKTNVRNNLPDPLFRVTANRTIALILAGGDGQAHFRGFGKTHSPTTFGHNGAGGQIAFADPESGVSFCYLTNGYDRHMLRLARRTIGIASRAGLVTTPV